MNSNNEKSTSEITKPQEKNNFHVIDDLINYIQKNPIKSLTAIPFFFGSLQLFIFFIRIGYMPEINFSSIGSILYSIAILSIIIFFYYLSCLIASGLVIYYAKKKVTAVSKTHLNCLIVAAFILSVMLVCLSFNLSTGIYSINNWYISILSVIAALGIILIGIIHTGSNQLVKDIIEFNNFKKTSIKKRIYLELKKRIIQTFIKYRKILAKCKILLGLTLAIILISGICSHFFLQISIVNCLYIPIAIFPTFVSILLFRKYKNNENIKDGTSEKPKISEEWDLNKNLKRNFLWSMYVTVALVVMYILVFGIFSIIWASSDLSYETANSFTFKIALIIGISAISSFLIGLSEHKSQLIYSSILCIYLLIIIFSQINFLSDFLFIGIKNFRIGEINSARLAVTGKTCQEINLTLGKKVCESKSNEAITTICPVMIKSRIGSEMVLEFIALEEIASKQNNEPNKNSNASMSQDNIHQPKHFSWITTKTPDNNDISKRITQLVILDKTKILSWQPLARINEKDFKDTKKYHTHQNSLSKSTISKSVTDNDSEDIKLLTLYDAKQNTSAGKASDVDKFLLQHCREYLDESDNLNPI